MAYAAPAGAFGPAVGARVAVVLSTLVGLLAVYNAIDPGLRYASGGLQVAGVVTIIASSVFLAAPSQKTVSIPVSINNAISTSIPAGLLWAKRLRYRTDALARWSFTAAVVFELSYLILAHWRVISRLRPADMEAPRSPSLPRYRFAPYLGGALLVSGLIQLVAAVVHVVDRGHAQTRLVVLGLAIASAAGHLLTSVVFWQKKGGDDFTPQIIGSGVAAFAGLAILPLAYDVHDTFLVGAALAHAASEVVVVTTLHAYT